LEPDWTSAFRGRDRDKGGMGKDRGREGNRKGGKRGEGRGGVRRRRGREEEGKGRFWKPPPYGKAKYTTEYNVQFMYFYSKIFVPPLTIFVVKSISSLH
jgi:hypothetical protein